jgi:hypothetical protein
MGLLPPGYVQDLVLARTRDFAGAKILEPFLCHICGLSVFGAAYGRSLCGASAGGHSISQLPAVGRSAHKDLCLPHLGRRLRIRVDLACLALICRYEPYG